ncbi:uncharacterized protein LOC135160842 [Diachasmimorpha longicaudata]|uniref:uncharacterized protein LOC135160842 n=1 Tax=Diachasmimorpha longicaudata TaxID=58733 RepID=UPI0030B87DF9
MFQIFGSQRISKCRRLIGNLDIGSRIIRTRIEITDNVNIYKRISKTDTAASPEGCSKFLDYNEMLETHLEPTYCYWLTTGLMHSFSIGLRCFNVGSETPMTTIIMLTQLHSGQ